MPIGRKLRVFLCHASRDEQEDEENPNSKKNNGNLRNCP